MVCRRALTIWSHVSGDRDPNWTWPASGINCRLFNLWYHILFNFYKACTNWLAITPIGLRCFLMSISKWFQLHIKIIFADDYFYWFRAKDKFAFNFNMFAGKYCAPVIILPNSSSETHFSNFSCEVRRYLYFLCFFVIFLAEKQVRNILHKCKDIFKILVHVTKTYFCSDILSVKYFRVIHNYISIIIQTQNQDLANIIYCVPSLLCTRYINLNKNPVM